MTLPPPDPRDAEIAPLREENARLRRLLDLFRYAKAFAGADAWDGGPDMRERFAFAASQADAELGEMSNNDIAAIGQAMAPFLNSGTAILATRDATIKALREANAKQREALEGMLMEWDKFTRYGSPMAKAENERVNFARAALTREPGDGE